MRDQPANINGSCGNLKPLDSRRTIRLGKKERSYTQGVDGSMCVSFVMKPSTCLPYLGPYFANTKYRTNCVTV